jgi:hypothetical protein
MSNFPKISFGIIVLNGEPFIKYNLRSLYPFAHEVIIVEGAVRDARSIATEDGHSIDGTLDALYRFKDEDDYQNKIQIITSDGFWDEKDEMSKAYSTLATGDFLWQIDIDEFYKENDMKAIVKMLADDSEISAVSFKTLFFWGGFDHLCDGWYLRRGGETFHRIFRWGPGFQYIKHRPPTVVDNSGTDLRNYKYIDGSELANNGIYMYHYSLVFPKQIKEKCEYYRNAKWARRKKMIEWSKGSYFSLTNPFRVHNVYDYPSWLIRFEGTHPHEIMNLCYDISNKIVSIEVRKNDDVEDLIDSIPYKLGCSYFKLIRKPDELIQKIRHILGKIVKTLFHTIEVARTKTVK